MKISLISAPLFWTCRSKKRFDRENTTASPRAEVTAEGLLVLAARFGLWRAAAAAYAMMTLGAAAAAFFCGAQKRNKRAVYACERRLPKARAL
jgi:hypothetical protein